MLTALYSSNRGRCLLAQANDFNFQTTEIQEVKTFSRRFFFFSPAFRKSECLFFIGCFRWIYDKAELCNIFPFPPIYFYLIGRSKISLLIIRLRARPQVKIVD